MCVYSVFELYIVYIIYIFILKIDNSKLFELKVCDEETGMVSNGFSSHCVCRAAVN